jgi:hypothetical protein
MGGCCTVREKVSKLSEPDYLPMEIKVYDTECELGFDTVNFNVFLGALKRFGFHNDLGDV